MGKRYPHVTVNIDTNEAWQHLRAGLGHNPIAGTGYRVIIDSVEVALTPEGPQILWASGVYVAAAAYGCPEGPQQFPFADFAKGNQRHLTELVVDALR